MATTRAASHHSPNRSEHRTDRESVRGPISEAGAERDSVFDRGAINLRAAIRDRTSVGESASVSDDESSRFTNARTGTFEDARSDVCAGGVRRHVERSRGAAAALGDRIEDGEPLDSNVDGGVRRRPDGLTKPERLDASVRDACAIPFTIPFTQLFTHAIAGTERVIVADRVFPERQPNAERKSDANAER